MIKIAYVCKSKNEGSSSWSFNPGLLDVDRSRGSLEVRDRLSFFLYLHPPTCHSEAICPALISHIWQLSRLGRRAHQSPLAGIRSFFKSDKSSGPVGPLAPVPKTKITIVHRTRGERKSTTDHSVDKVEP